MAGEEQQITGFYMFQGNFVDGEVLHDMGVPVNKNAAEHIGRGHQTGAVNAHGGLAAPAVMGALIEHGGVHQCLTKGFLVLRQGRGIVLSEDAFRDEARSAIRQTYLLPALLRLTHR